MKPWYRFQNVADDPAVAEIFLFNDIGGWIDDQIDQFWGPGASGTTTAKSFIDQLAQLSDAVKSVRVHINSGGGDVFGAVAIANALRDQQKTKGRIVETYVDGLAASAASIVMMAGSRICIADNGLVMVHNPATFIAGTAADMRKTADAMDALRDTIVATYQWHSTLDNAALIAMMDAETWLTADDAIANGFCTDKVEGLQAVASLDRRVTARLSIPEQFKARVEAFLEKPAVSPVTASAADVLAAVDAAGLNVAFARELVAAKLPMAEITARITTAKNDRAAKEARTAEIRTLCATAKLPELADGYIAGAMNVADIRAHLTTITAKLDRVEIDTNIDPSAGARAKTKIDPAAVYTLRNKH